MNHSGTISSDEVWYLTGSPHIVTDNITLQATLTIEAGCEVKVETGKRFTLNHASAKIIAVGTSNDLITFTDNDKTPTNGWGDAVGGIYATNVAAGCRFNYCKFTGYANQHNSKYVYWIASTTFEFENCILTEKSDATLNRDGIYIQNATVTIDHCVFDNLYWTILAMNGSNVTVKNSILQNNFIALIQSGTGVLTSKYNNFYNNGTDYSGTIGDKTGDELARDPEFVGGSPYDFHLDTGSPCIGDGESGEDMGLEDYLSATLELIDIANDFRMLKLWALEDIANDFRMVSNIVRTDIDNDFRMSGASLYDVDNDFRMTGTLLRVDINNEFRFRKEDLYDINNKFHMVKEVIEDIDNDFRSVIEVETDIYNDVRFVDQNVSDITNDFRTRKETSNDIQNDFRMVCQWQLC